MTVLNTLAEPLPLPLSPIQRSVEELHSQISANGEVLDYLSRRLEYITASAPELTEDENKMTSNCALEIELARASARLREQNQRLNYLLRNIQL